MHYPLDSEVELALITDVSDTSLGTIFLQKTKAKWQPLAFLSKKLSQAQIKYRFYNR